MICFISVSSYMLTWRFAVQLNRSLVEIVGLVIEKTQVVYLKSFSCVVVKKTFQVTCGVASFQTQNMRLILFCCVPTSSRRQKILMILQTAPLIDQISVLGGVVVPADVGYQKSILKADRGIGKRVSQMELKMSGKFVQSGFGK